MTPTVGRMAAAIRLNREDHYVYADCNRMLCAGLRQLGDGAADRDADGAASCWNSVFEHYHGPAIFNDRATDSDYHTGGGPEHNANAEYTRHAASEHTPNDTGSGNARKHGAKHRHYAESNGHAVDSLRSTDARLFRDGFESWKHESDNAWIHHTELDSEFRCAGFERSWINEPIPA